jgi:PKHD-type hydroxylase
VKHTHLFYESAVSPDLCNKLIAPFSEDNFNSGVIGTEEYGRINKNIRDADTQWAPKYDLIECILTRYIIQANLEALWNFDITEPEQVQIGRYKENQFYNQHIDCFVKGSDIIDIGNGSGFVIPIKNQRKISASLILNDESEYDGGDLFILDETVKVRKQGTIIVFPSFMAHRVTPVTRGVRYSAVCWMLGPKWK